MDLIKLLDVADPRHIKDTINLLIQDTASFETRVGNIAEHAESVAEQALESSASVATAAAQAVVDTKVDKIVGKGLSTEDYTTAEKQKLAGLENYVDTEINARVDQVEAEVATKVDKVTGKGLSTNDYTDAEKQKLANLASYESDPVFAASPAAGISAQDILDWNAKQDAINDLVTIRSGAAAGATAVQDANYVHTDNNYTTAEKNKLAGIDLTPYSLISETGSKIVLELDSTDYKITAKLKDKNDVVISTSNAIDLPLESVVVGGSYDSTNQKIILTLENGNTIDVPVGALISGLQSEITSSNKLDADLVDDTNAAHKFVLATDKSAWNAKYDKPSGGIPDTDLAEKYVKQVDGSNTYVYGKVDYENTEGVIPYSAALASAGYLVARHTDGHVMVPQTPTQANHAVSKSHLDSNFLSFTDSEQTLTSEQQGLVRSKIGAGSSTFSGSYVDLSNKPTINTNNSSSLATNSAESIETSINLHKISKTGKLADTIKDSSNRVVTDAEKTTWNTHYNNGIVNAQSSKRWIPKTWYGLTDFAGSHIWTDGENIYCSQNSTHYKLNKLTDTWEAVTFTGLTSFDGQLIWNLGEHTYYSYGTSQYELNKETRTWTAKTWSGLTSFDARQIWVNNTHKSYEGSTYSGPYVFYSNGSSHYILDIGTSTWSSFSFSGLSSFYGQDVWSDGVDIYCSSSNGTYMLTSARVWSSKSLGMSVARNDMWTDGNDWYYCSYSGGLTWLYKFNPVKKYWESAGYLEINLGASVYPHWNIWTDGEHTYYSNGTTQYVLNISKTTVPHLETSARTNANKIDWIKPILRDLKNSKQDAITSTNKLDYSLLSNTPTIPTKTSDLTNDGDGTSNFARLSDLPTVPTSIDGMSGGTLTSALILTGGDGASGVANIQLDTNGQITAKNTTSTLFGRSNATTLLLGHSSHALTIRGSATRPTYNGNSMALYSDIPSVPVTDVQLNGSSVVSSGVANVKALPNYSLSIGSTNGGNPRQVKFLSVNYTSYDGNNACFVKLGAMCSHGNGASYTFMDDIFIGVSSTGSVICNVYKYFQQETTLDGVTRNYGDVFYTIDTTNKVVDFYILLGQYSTANFTPYTKIGATTTTGITQYSGTPTYYSSGTKTWATGNSTLYARLSDIPTVNNATLTIQKNGSSVATFTANASSNVTANISVPTNISASPAIGYGTTVTSGSTSISNGTYYIFGRGSTGSGTWYKISVGGTEVVAYRNVNQGYGSSNLWLSGFVTVTTAQTITHNLSGCWYQKLSLS